MIFEDWLIEQRFREDNVGDLARDYFFTFREMKREPYGSPKMMTLSESMNQFMCCKESFDAAAAAREEYELHIKL